MTGPDFTHHGELFGFDATQLDGRFERVIEIARSNVGENVELFRYSAEQPDAPQVERWWNQQRRLIRRHVGALDTLSLIVSCRTDKTIGVRRAYVRFNRKRVATRAAS